MSWDFEDFVTLVKKRAPKGEVRGLLKAPTKSFDAKRYPNISLVYYSMPDWCNIFFTKNSNPVHPVDFDVYLRSKKFDAIIHEYKHAIQKYYENVLKLGLNCLVGRITGRALLHEISSVHRHSLRIMPYWHWYQAIVGDRPYNSSPRPIYRGEKLVSVSEGTAGNYGDAYEKGAPFYDEYNRATDDKGTGKGADVVLFYSPEIWQSTGKPTGPGFEPDEVLFHELIHVSRELRGRETSLPVYGGGGYGNEEEYLATVIANMYLSEKNKDLRGSYSDPYQRPRQCKVKGEVKFWVIDPSPKSSSVLRDPDKFYQNPDNTSMSPSELIGRFSKTQDKFYSALAKLPDGSPKFNPIKQHLKENTPINI